MPDTHALRADLRARVAAEQLRAHYRQVPAMVIAPTLGGLFTAWVLWGAVDNRYLVIGMAAVVVLSLLRLAVYRQYLRVPEAQAAAQRRWRWWAVGAALVSGCIWGSAALVLYPPRAAGYEVYLLVLLTLLPIVPVAALAAWMPSFYAYYIPCTLPFVLTLALADSHPERMTALLLVMMLMAMSTFARRYARGLADAIALRLQLAEQAQALEGAILQKSRFIAAASHDLRQPVHAMGLFVESLRAGVADRGALAYLGASLRTLRGMLDDMLEISRLDARVVAPQARDFDAVELLARLRAEYAPLAARQGLEFRCRAQAAVIHSDPALLERMLRNLLANALKFTRRGGVALLCRGHGLQVRLQVADTGSGIAAVHQQRVFEEFTQLDNPDREQAKGLGLGLAIVQRLARLLGHGLTLRSVPGRGSVFTLRVARGQGPALPLQGLPAQGESPAMPPRRVLVVDDDEAVGAATAALLRQWGHHALVARSGAQAVEVLNARGDVPDLLIVDFRLAHGESGLDAIAALRRALGRPVPAIVITGDTAPQRIRESLAAGHALLHKPVDPERLRACIGALVA